MKNTILTLLLCVLSTFGITAKDNKTQYDEVYKSENLIIYKITNHVYEHISYLNTQDWGKVPCNGMIVIDKNEAIVFDTPPDDKTSQELIECINKNLNCKITAIISTHHHIDNLGGLNAFHNNNIPSYAYKQTIVLAKKQGYTLPQNSFETIMEFKVGDKNVYAEFIGEGHTKDNIIAYFPYEDIMFGGCLIKENGAGKGNLEDANVNNWAETVEKLKLKYPQTKIVIPGHGDIGGIELLDYTIKLFK